MLGKNFLHSNKSPKYSSTQQWWFIACHIMQGSEVGNASRKRPVEAHFCGEDITSPLLLLLDTGSEIN